MDVAADGLPPASEADQPRPLEVDDPHEHVGAAEHDDDLASLDPVDAHLQDGPLRLRRLGDRGPGQAEQRQEQEEGAAEGMLTREAGWRDAGRPVMAHRLTR